jgi:hypothetical protein
MNHSATAILTAAQRFSPSGYLGAHGVILVSGQCKGRQNADDGNDDQQLDQGEAFGCAAHKTIPLFL